MYIHGETFQMHNLNLNDTKRVLIHGLSLESLNFTKENTIRF